jgi:curli biogenesis system outer membrane secretion channel CsgG
MFFAAGCFSTKPHAQLDKSLTGEPLGRYFGPKAKIAVSDFELKTSGANAQAGIALKDAFIGILNNTQRFSIVAQQEADLIINVEINEFVPESSGGKSGVGGGGSGQSNFMGGLLGAPLNKANMQLGLRIIDHVSSSVISSRDIHSQAAQSPGKKIKVRGMVFKAGLSAYADTPMGKVIYDCLIEAARYIAQNAPLGYYKY